MSDKAAIDLVQELEARVYKDSDEKISLAQQLKESQAENERLRLLIKDAGDYLDISKHTCIGHGSILHREFKQALTPKE